MKNIIVLSICLLVVVSCSLDGKKEVSFTTGNADFSRYVAIGGSITAGFQSGALISEHQEYSYPALLARQAGVDNFVQPLIEYPGVGTYTVSGAGILELESLSPLKIVPVSYAKYSAFDSSSPYISDEIRDWSQPYNNLGQPGVLLADLNQSLTSFESFSRSLFIDIVLRNEGKPAQEQKTTVQQAIELNPTFITVWIGNSDILAYALTGGVNESFLTSVADFTTNYTALIDSLSATGADIVIANLPDVRNIAYFTTLPTYLFDIARNQPVLDSLGNQIPLVGVDSGDLVLLSAIDTLSRGTGIPIENNGNGNPLPDLFFLDQEEIEILSNRIIAFNGLINNIAENRGIPMVNFNEFLFELTFTGRSIPGHTFSGHFLTGGFFSLDGLHPLDGGNALIANLWIEEINEHFSASIPPVNVVEAMSH